MSTIYFLFQFTKILRRQLRSILERRSNKNRLLVHRRKTNTTQRNSQTLKKWPPDRKDLSKQITCKARCVVCGSAVLTFSPGSKVVDLGKFDVWREAPILLRSHEDGMLYLGLKCFCSFCNVCVHFVTRTVGKTFFATSVMSGMGFVLFCFVFMSFQKNV